MKDKKKFSENISGMKIDNLVVVDFSDLSIAELLEIEAAAINNQKLRVMKFNGCNLSIEQAVVLARIIEKHPSLQKLELDNNNLGDDGVAILCQAIKRSKQTIGKLSLCANNITALGAGALRELLDLDLLHELRLDGNPLATAGIEALFTVAGEDLYDAARETSKLNTKLKFLSLIDCAINQQAAKLLAESLVLFPRLKELYLDRNPLGDDGVSHIALALGCESSLEKLYMVKCGFEQHGAWSLGRMLKRTIRLQLLDIDGNSLGVEGLQSSDGTEGLVLGLCTNTYLDGISLARTSLSNAGALLIAELIRNSYSLISIDLSGNEISSYESLKALTSAMQVNTSITAMDLHDNPIADLSVDLFIAMLKINTSLSVLGLLGCKMTDLGARLLLDFIKQEITVKDSSVNLSLSSDSLSQAMKISLNRFIESDYRFNIVSTIIDIRSSDEDLGYDGDQDDDEDENAAMMTSLVSDMDTINIGAKRKRQRL